MVRPFTDPLQFAYQPRLRVEDSIIFLLNRVYTHLEKPASTVSQSEVSSLSRDLLWTDDYTTVGFPNAGKSSLLRAISNARPAVASYPFTTLNTQIGIVQYRNHEQVAVADIPGIVRGAHLNRGLGISFLRHIERCRFLLFVLDLSAPEPWTQLQPLCYELDQYEPGLSQRPQAIVANKMEIPEAREELETLKSHVTRRVIPVSALRGNNTEELILHLRELYDGYLQGDEGRGVKPIRW